MIMVVENGRSQAVFQIAGACMAERLSMISLSRGVKHRADAVFFCQAEKLRHEIQLQERFTAADRDAALFAPVALVAERLL